MKGTIQERKKKIDLVSGNYTSFPGFTVVADVYDQNREFFSEIYKRLSDSQVITEYYALLPLESYHITQFGINEQKAMTDSQWNSWIKQNQDNLTMVHDLFSQQPEFEFRMSSIKDNRLTFLVSIDQQTVDRHRAVANASNFGREHFHHPHISLGYERKRISSKSTVPQEINNELNKILTEVQQQFSVGVLRASKPELCYFYDMTKFIPFDGKSNPFVTTEDNQAKNVLPDIEWLRDGNEADGSK